MDKRPIGFMDSGVGGLTVVKETLKQLPNESMVFLGDQGRMPYGPRTPQEVKRFSLQMAYFLKAQNVKILVIACNTATAAALPEIKKKLDIPVVGVIKAGSEKAVRQSKTGHIGIIATKGTINSRAYNHAISDLSPHIKITGLACPEFVIAVEHNTYRSLETKKIVADKLDFFKHHLVDTLILGCTHFPLLKPFISVAIGRDIPLIDSGVETVNTINAILTDNNQLNDGYEPSFKSFYTTGPSSIFEDIARSWLTTVDLTAMTIPVAKLEQMTK